ncbi:MAG: bifunctional nicotinamidase/pyrazinamidase [Treponema sp.]|jgi:nicotinamidase/pyrazinamidase|nr:bifunctional nicotinamidase/pyrazinamidase [Treponema sp.]
MIGDIRSALLLIIDVQNDFCPACVSLSGEKYPAGALAVNRGDEVIGPLNRLAAAFAGAGGPVAATQDWHPGGHVSFASAHPGKKPGDLIDLPPDRAAETPRIQGQVLWPDHCVQGSRGAAFHERLDRKPLNLILRKGFRPGLDSYSAFFENDRRTPTGLEGWLRGLGIGTVVMGGLATDYCVLYSALDARRLGFTVIVLEDAVRGVGYPEGSVEKALDDMKKQGIRLCGSEKFLKEAGL